MNETVGCVIPDDLSVAGTHVLVIGVSRYVHGLDSENPSSLCTELGIHDLECAARSASRIANWLLQRDTTGSLPPLASMRVLLSPLERELDNEVRSPRLHGVARANRANVEAAAQHFRIACESHRDNHAIVYVAGHGIQITKDGAVLLLEDFGDANAPSNLHAAVDMISLHDGLDHAKAPKQQCWFVDICRERPDIAYDYVRLRAGVAYDEPDNGTVESSPLFLSTATGKKSYLRIGGISLFCEALLWALERGGAATGGNDTIEQWHVPFSALSDKIPKYVDKISQRVQLRQKVDVGGKMTPGVLHVYPVRPSVDLTVVLTPEDAPVTSSLKMQDDGLNVVFECTSRWPGRMQLSAGLYRMQVTNAAPYGDYGKLIQLVPPEQEHTVTLR